MENRLSNVRNTNVEGYLFLRRKPMLKRTTLIGFFAGLPGLASDRPRPSPKSSPGISVLLLALLSAFALAGTSHAQAIPAATGGGRIDVFGSFNITSPDYGPVENFGGSAGVALLTRRFFFGQPGLAFRYAKTTGSTVNETFVGGGVESHYKFGRIRPYATLLYGVGGLAVPQKGGYSDSGDELLIGGGVDVPISRRFAVRGEFDYGFLKISGKGGTSQGELNLTPASYNIGLVYHIR